MLLEAAKYVASTPKLEWIYLGEYPMTVMEASSEAGRLAVPLCEESDGCDTLLNRIFGWKGMSSS
jgi:hypothetical protein